MQRGNAHIRNIRNQITPSDTQKTLAPGFSKLVTFYIKVYGTQNYHNKCRANSLLKLSLENSWSISKVISTGKRLQLENAFPSTELNYTSVLIIAKWENDMKANILHISCWYKTHNNGLQVGLWEQVYKCNYANIYLAELHM